MIVSARVDEVYWERVNLHIWLTLVEVPHDQAPRHWVAARVQNQESTVGTQQVRFDLVSNGNGIPLEVIETTPGGRFHLRLNITNAKDRAELPNGVWRIRPYVADVPCDLTHIDPSMSDALREKSKTFVYHGGWNAYVVTIDHSDHIDFPEFRISVRNFNRPPQWRHYTGSISRRFAQWSFDRGILQLWFQLVYNVLRATRPRGGKKRILLAAQLRPDIRDNMLVLKRRLVDRGLDSQFKIEESLHWKYRSLRHSFWRWTVMLRKFAWADFVFVDDWCALLSYVHLSRDTTVTQLWHAGHGVKAVGLARFGLRGSPRLNNPHRHYTYGIVGSEGLRDIYAEDFGMEREGLLPTGVLRIDDLLDPVTIARARTTFAEYYPSLTGKRVILFAPTFRGRGSGTATYNFGLLDMAALHEWCGDDTVVVFRMHPYVTAKRTLPDGTYSSFIPEELRDRLIDASGFPSSNDLLHVTDVLITDYSSICYEFSYLDRPMLFFAPDEIAYAASRGFHDGYREVVPGKTVSTFDEMLASLRSGDFETWRRDRYRKRFCGPADMHNADRAIDYILLGERDSAALQALGSQGGPLGDD